MRLARIVEHLLDQFALLAALRHADRCLAIHADAQGLLEQRPVLEIVGDQDHPRRRLVVVELSDEGAKDLAGRQRRVGLGEIGAVAPVLPGAEEEHLDAGHAGIMMDGKHIGFFDGCGLMPWWLCTWLSADRRSR
jgi:hypothetical protein